MSLDPHFRDRYPELVALFGGYFHQDFDFDYGSPEETIDAYARDVGPERSRGFVREMRALLAASPDDELERMLERSGNCYAFETRAFDARGWLTYVVERLDAANATA